MGIHFIAAGTLLFLATCVGAFYIGRAAGRTPVETGRRRWIILTDR